MAVGSGGSGGAAGSIRAGRAHVEMSAKDAGLTKTLQALERRMLTVAKVAATMGAALIAAIGTTLVGAFKSAVDHFDKMKKAADRLGTTTDKISALGYAAEQSGASFEEMEVAAKNLNKNLEVNADAFKEFGLDAEKLKKLGLDEQMIAIADAISSMPDASERTAAAMKLLGKSGTQLLPLFMSGQLRGLLKEAGDVGAIIDPTKAAQAERIGDAVSRAWSSVVNTLREVGSSFFGGVDNIELFSRAVVLSLKVIRDDLIPAMKEWISDLMPEMSESFAKTWDGIRNAIQGGDIKLAFKIVAAAVEVEWRELVLGLTGIWIDFKETFVDTFHDAMTEVKVLIVQGAAFIREHLGNIFKDNAAGRFIADNPEAFGLLGMVAAADKAGVTEADVRAKAQEEALKRRAARAKEAAEALNDLAKAQKRLNDLTQRAAGLNANDPFLQNQVFLAQFALNASMQAMRNRPGASLGSSESRGSFSTFAAQQALGVGSSFDKIERNTRRAADKLDEIDDDLGNLVPRVL